MKKLTKVLCTGLLCTLCLCPGTVNAANVSNDTVIANENVKKDSNMNENKACQDINSKWNALSEKQKKDIYKSYKCKLDAEFKLVDKLCKYGMISEEDATKIKEDMMDNYKARKENKELVITVNGKNIKLNYSFTERQKEILFAGGLLNWIKEGIK